MERLERKTELLEGMKWYIDIRWGIVVGAPLAAWLIKLVGNLSFSVVPILFIALAIAFYNSIMALYLKYLSKKKPLVSEAKIDGFVKVQTTLDMLAIAAAVHFTGGVESPFIFLFVFHMITPGVFLPVPASYVHGTMAVLLYTALVLLQYFHITPHSHLLSLGATDPAHNLRYVLAMILVLAGALFFVAYLSATMAGRLKARRERLAALWELSQCAFAEPNLSQLLERALTVVLPLFGTNLGGIFLWDKEQEKFAIKAYRGNRRLWEKVCYNLGNGLCDDVVKESKVKVAEDLSAHPDEVYLGSMKGQTRSEICLPLKSRGQLVGLLSIRTEKPRRYSEGEKGFLITVADRIAVAVDSVQLLTRVKQKAAEASVLYQVGKAVSSTLDLSKLLTLSLDSVLAILQAKTGSIMLLDERGELTIRAARGLSKEVVERTRLKVGVGISGWVAKTGESLLITNLDKDKRFNKIKSVSEKKIKDALIVPFKVKDRIIGVFNVNDRISGIFTQDDLSLLATLANEVAVAIENAHLYQDVKASFVATIEALAKAVDAKDAYTAGHSERVASYAFAIARELGFSEEKAKGVETAARLHDIGKIGVSENILLKPDRLTRDEMAVVKRHPLIGVEIIHPVKFSEEIILSVKQHHEQPDGRGYPDGISRREITLGASILRVADAYEAMTSRRPYRRALSQREAFDELKKYAGSQFDPAVVDTFLKVVRRKEKRMRVVA